MTCCCRRGYHSDQPELGSPVPPSIVPCAAILCLGLQAGQERWTQAHRQDIRQCCTLLPCNESATSGFGNVPSSTTKALPYNLPYDSSHAATIQSHIPVTHLYVIEPWQLVTTPGKSCPSRTGCAHTRCRGAWELSSTFFKTLNHMGCYRAYCIIAST